MKTVSDKVVIHIGLTIHAKMIAVDTHTWNFESNCPR